MRTSDHRATASAGASAGACDLISSMRLWLRAKARSKTMAVGFMWAQVCPRVQVRSYQCRRNSERGSHLFFLTKILTFQYKCKFQAGLKFNLLYSIHIHNLTTVWVDSRKNHERNICLRFPSLSRPPCTPGPHTCSPPSTSLPSPLLSAWPPNLSFLNQDLSFFLKT